MKTILFMNGYGPYVWSSFGVVLVVLVTQLMVAIKAYRALS